MVFIDLQPQTRGFRMAVVAINVRVIALLHIEPLAFFFGRAHRVVPLRLRTSETSIDLIGVVSTCANTCIRLKCAFAPAGDRCGGSAG